MTLSTADKNSVSVATFRCEGYWTFDADFFLVFNSSWLSIAYWLWLRAAWLDTFRRHDIWLAYFYNLTCPCQKPHTSSGPFCSCPMLRILTWSVLERLRPCRLSLWSCTFQTLCIWLACLLACQAGRDEARLDSANDLPTLTTRPIRRITCVGVGKEALDNTQAAE